MNNSEILKIEKCSSPTGDGNRPENRLWLQKWWKKLRNVVPRQGTETRFLCTPGKFDFIEKCSSPTGDGNDTPCILHDF